jgi:5'-3' exoribonuclease 2
MNNFAETLPTQPAPETEEEMMVEVFKYTERVVNMARPRKVLMMAIGKSRMRPCLCGIRLMFAPAHRWSGSSSKDEPAAIKTFQSGAGSC